MKYLFFHIPKVAGTSIAAALPEQRWHNGPFAEHYTSDLFGSDPYLRPAKTWPCMHKHTGIIHKEAGKELVEIIKEKLYINKIGHLTPEQMFEVGLITPEQFDDYFTFCFVRNPWDRMLSVWAALAMAGCEKVAKQGIMSEEAYWGEIMSVESFSRKFLMREVGWLSRNFPGWYYKPYFKIHIIDRRSSQFRHISPGENISHLPKDQIMRLSYGANHMVPQNLYTHCRRSGKKVDFIGRYENLENDFKVVAKELSLGSDVSLSHVNSSSSRRKGRHYTEFYTKEARDIVAEIYADDIKMFGYKFGK